MAVVTESKPVQEEGVFINKSKNVIQSCAGDQSKPEPELKPQSSRNFSLLVRCKKIKSKTPKRRHKAKKVTFRYKTKKGLTLEKLFALFIIGLSLPKLTHGLPVAKYCHASVTFTTNPSIMDVKTEDVYRLTDGVMCPKMLIAAHLYHYCFHNDTSVYIQTPSHNGSCPQLILEHGNGREKSDNINLLLTEERTPMEGDSDAHVSRDNATVTGEKASMEDSLKTRAQNLGDLSNKSTAAGANGFLFFVLTPLLMLLMFVCKSHIDL